MRLTRGVVSPTLRCAEAGGEEIAATHAHAVERDTRTRHRAGHSESGAIAVISSIAGPPALPGSVSSTAEVSVHAKLDDA